MKILVFDTETTGLPTERNASLLSTNKWPYIVQLSYILYDTSNLIVLDYSDQIIKIPDNVTIPKVCEDIHKISTEISKTKGVDIKNELVNFNRVMLDADIIVAHNLIFDKNMITVECMRHKIVQHFTRNSVKKPQYCTMKNSITLCKIVAIGRNGGEYFKYPKLLELHKHLFNTIPDGLHNSMVDVLACLRCFGKMKYDVDYNENSPSLIALNVMYS